ncbi:efflux RND transporter periplasmic adaptor subunit [Noviherbaspirillum sp.]|jgi:HlyD family secretion protein|uniref:efflux RND transporter periplasmic adaptor subunit n=1 Tax=Noviherbaspirillum sp. TaxID=1926288 RepID=UPI0025CEC201|nr:efflux RND transporter periplasmic adaptor subunit [Noviherbaspirillum sp.]
MDSHTETKNARSVKKASRRWTLGVLGLVAAVLVAWYLFAPEPLVMEIAAVESGPLQVTVNNQGQVRVHDKYVVAAPVAAEIARIELHDGDPVAQGQEVATLSPLPMDERQRREAVARLDAAKALAREAALRAERAQTDMQFAINERARVERLVNDNFVSPQAVEKALTAERTSRAEWDAAKSREQAAAADVKAAEAALLADERPTKGGKRELRLTAPVGGYVLKVHEKSERTINAGSPLVTIGDPTRYEIVVDVLSTDAVKIHAGDLMLLEAWGGGKALRARVRLVEPVAFTKISALGVEEQRVNIIADPVDPLGPLGDGYRIEARIVIWQDDKVTKLPASSLFRVGEEWHVFVVENGRAKERAVTVGQRNQDEAQILSGLAPGARVIRYPSNQLSDGARITAAGR